MDFCKLLPVTESYGFYKIKKMSEKRVIRCNAKYKIGRSTYLFFIFRMKHEIYFFSPLDIQNGYFISKKDISKSVFKNITIH